MQPAAPTDERRREDRRSDDDDEDVLVVFRRRPWVRFEVAKIDDRNIELAAMGADHSNAVDHLTAAAAENPEDRYAIGVAGPSRAYAALQIPADRALTESRDDGADSLGRSSLDARLFPERGSRPKDSCCGCSIA